MDGEVGEIHKFLVVIGILSTLNKNIVELKFKASIFLFQTGNYCLISVFQHLSMNARSEIYDYNLLFVSVL